ncbi:Protein C15C6.1 [Aphelenchoides avenae]|nr:Protein C15C6.1 [Aphelenchus avenae]
MHILITIGIAAIVAVATAQWLYFRKSIFVLAIPIVVTLVTEFAVYMRRGDLIWPVIGISFFHLFLAGYAFLIFSFFFFFKPLYIIMVLNWAFDSKFRSRQENVC